MDGSRASFGPEKLPAHQEFLGVGGDSVKRKTPAVAALDDHGRVCRRCIAAARAGLPPIAFCSWGRVLYRCAKREQARFRRAS